MRIAIASAAVAAAIAAGITYFALQDDEKEGNIVVYRDVNDVCQTITTPFFKVSKGNDKKVKWKIRDGFGCVSADSRVSLRFDKGDADPLPNCEKVGTNKIECELEDDDDVLPTERPRRYSVWLGERRTEDPELQIEI